MRARLDPTSVAAISNIGTRGVVTPVQSGATDVTATFNGVASPATTLKVANDNLTCRR
jgi:hypothetical protein